MTISFHFAEDQILEATLYCSIRLCSKVLTNSDISNHNIQMLQLLWLLLTADFQADHKIGIKRKSSLCVSDVCTLGLFSWHMQTIRLYKDAAYKHVGGTVILNVTNLDVLENEQQIQRRKNSII